MDAALGAAACPKPGVTAAATNVTRMRKFRRRTFMLPSTYGSNDATPCARAHERMNGPSRRSSPLLMAFGGQDGVEEIEC
jgi:hypothetical protein